MREHGDAQCFEAGDEIAIGLQHHEIRLVCGDGLDIGVPAIQVGDGSFGRVVRELVDGHDAVAGADGEQDLGAGRGDRHDPLEFAVLFRFRVAAGASGRHKTQGGNCPQQPPRQRGSSC